MEFHECVPKRARIEAKGKAEEGGMTSQESTGSQEGPSRGHGERDAQGKGPLDLGRSQANAKRAWM